jgi:hypothetical protein
MQPNERLIRGRDLNGSQADFRYIISPMSASDSLLVEAELVRMLGEPLAKLFATDKEEINRLISSGVDIEKVKIAVGNKALSGMVSALAKVADGKAVLFVVKTLLEGKTLRNGKPLVFDVDYQRNTVEMWKAVMFAIEVNFGDFYEVLGMLGVGAPSTPGTVQA